MKKNMILNICIIFIALVLYSIYSILYKFDFLLQVNYFPVQNNCSYHDQKHIGSEDFTKISNNVILGISNDIISMLKGQYNDPGYIWILNLDTNISYKPQIQNLPKNFVFNPHGIYYENQTQILSVLNHPFQGKGDRIEQFQLQLNNLEEVQIKFLRSLQLPSYLNGNANDILQITQNEFLVSQFQSEQFEDLNDSNTENFQGQKVFLLSSLKSIFDMKQTFIHSCIIEQNDELNCVKTKARGNGMNGIAWNKQDYVLAADTLNQNKNVLHQYKLDLITNQRENRLIFKQYIETNGHPDNIDYDQYLQQYTVAGMVKLHQYMTNIKKQKKIHPKFENSSKDFYQYVDIIKEENGVFQVKNVLSINDGISGCSVAVQYKDNLILGSFYDQTIQICDYKGENDFKQYQISIFTFIKQILGF